jgi:hypothetical protein
VTLDKEQAASYFLKISPLGREKFSSGGEADPWHCLTLLFFLHLGGAHVRKHHFGEFQGVQELEPAGTKTSDNSFGHKQLWKKFNLTEHFTS